jgi:hypothetical protein
MMLTRTFVLASSLLAAATAVAEATPPRYARAIEQELSAMGIDARCDLRDDRRQHCSYSRASTGPGRKLDVETVYSDESDTVYVYVARYLVLAPDAAATQTVLRRLMELNWELLLGKFEWNPRTGEVRLSAMLNTDSNFDRRAFRSLIHGIEALATRHEAELRGLSSQ